MGQASDSIQITISQGVAALLLPGFGEPMIAAYHTHYTDRLRHYSANAAGLAQMVTDGFSTSEAAYIAAQAITAQSPAPVRFAVGRLALAPTQQFTYTPTAALAAGQFYGLLIDGQLVSYTSVGVDSATTISNGLRTAFAALGSPPAMTASGTATFILTANTAGAFHYTQVVDSNSLATPQARAELSLAQTHADPGIQTDLAAIALFDNSWYGLINPFDSKLMALAAAAWVESNQKLYIVCSVDDAILTSSSSDVASSVKSSAYTRTAVLYKTENKSQAQAAWMSAVFPLVAGSENWAYKTLAGVPADVLSENEKGNACGIPTAGTQGKRASIYETIFGKNVTEFGQVGSGSWLDITRGLDAFVVDVSASMFSDLSGANKVPYTDKGVAILEKDLRAVIAKYQDPSHNFIADAPVPIVTAPSVTTLSSSQKASRVYPSLNFSFTLAGAINGVQVQGTVLS
jgi:hypothetical protein